MKIVYIPYISKTNRYILISQECIKSIGHEILNKDSATKNYKIIILNWYENLPNQVGFVIDLLVMFQKYLFLEYLHKKGKCIITTFHNKTPHNTKNRWLNQQCMRMILKESDRIIILSEASKKELYRYLDIDTVLKKVYLIPHPNYIGAYGKIVNNSSIFNSPKMKLLFIGQVKRYKNIELILEMAERFQKFNIQFTIVGKPESEHYRRELIQKTEKLSNVELRLQFVKDEEMAHLLSEHHLLLLPYDVKSSMNSGTVILAFSYMKTVICPNIATIQDYDSHLIYSYDYDDEKEHADHLYQKILEAYDDWNDDSEIFARKGKQLYELVKENNSKEKITQCYRKLFQSI